MRSLPWREENTRASSGMKTARRWPSTNQGAGPRWEPNLPPPWSQTFSLPAVSGLSQQTMLKAKIIQAAATWFSNGEGNGVAGRWKPAMGVEEWPWISNTSLTAWFDSLCAGVVLMSVKSNLKTRSKWPEGKPGSLQIGDYRDFISYESHSVVSDSLWPHGLHSSWNSPGQNTGVGSLSLLQGIFPTQGSNPVLPKCRWILHQLNHKGSPRLPEWVA